MKLFRMVVFGALATLALSGPMAGSALAAAECTDGKDRSVEIINETRYAIRVLQASAPGVAATAADDLLGNEIIEADTSRVVNMATKGCACVVDLKIVFSDGTVVTRRQFNACEEQMWRIHE